MKIEKIILLLVGIGLASALIQAILLKTITFGLFGFVFTTLGISIMLVLIPTATYGIIKSTEKVFT